MAGVIARRVFGAAGDAGAFPELEREEGLRPWRPEKLYQSTRFNRAGTTLTVPTGTLDPATGWSFAQLAAASRSQHRSQDFGILQPIGPDEVRLALVESRAAGPDTAVLAGVATEREWLAVLADSLRRRLVPAHLDALIPALAAAVERAGREPPSDRGDLALLHEALAVAAGVVVDARASSDRLAPGDTTALEVELFPAGAAPIAAPVVQVVAAAGGWRDTIPLTFVRAIETGRVAAARAIVTVPSRAGPTQPYFLARPLQGAMYDWSAADPGVRGLPMDAPPFTALIRLRIAGAAVELRREVTFRDQDQAVGEVRRPVTVTPRLEVAVEPDTIVWPAASADTHGVTVTVRHRGQGPVAGRVRLVTDGWPPPPEQPFALGGAGETVTRRFVLRRPTGVTRGDVTVHAEAMTEDGARFDHGAVEIAYPHIRPASRLRAAESRVRVAPIALPRVRSVGYVRGVSDRVPEALMGVGIPLVLLGPADLLRGDLAAYDVIVIGSRAFETDSALIRANDRLLAYARAGGRVLVQYQQYQYARGRYAPLPLSISQPHDRVTDEHSPARILVPSHPVFRAPNRLEPADWDGWPQERGLYFAGTWDAAWTPLLELQDPGGPPLRGGLLVARVGRGSYIYTGLSFFRALPAGTPGAFRLFLNLIAWDGSGE
jgi:hypothetical protein